MAAPTNSGATTTATAKEPKAGEGVSGHCEMWMWKDKVEIPGHPRVPAGDDTDDAVRKRVRRENYKEAWVENKANDAFWEMIGERTWERASPEQKEAAMKKYMEVRGEDMTKTDAQRELEGMQKGIYVGKIEGDARQYEHVMLADDGEWGCGYSGMNTALGKENFDFSPRHTFWDLLHTWRRLLAGHHRMEGAQLVAGFGECVQTMMEDANRELYTGVVPATNEMLYVWEKAKITAADRNDYDYNIGVPEQYHVQSYWGQVINHLFESKSAKGVSINMVPWCVKMGMYIHDFLIAKERMNLPVMRFVDFENGVYQDTTEGDKTQQKMVIYMDKQGEGNDQWKGVKHCMTVMQTNAPHVDAMKNGMDWGDLHMPWYGGNDDNTEKGQGWETVETVDPPPSCRRFALCPLAHAECC